MPMSFWTEQDVYEYIYTKKLPICSVYGDIEREENGKYHTTKCSRTGCVFCMFGAQMEDEPNRFQRLSVTHPKLYNYCMNGGQYNEDGWWQPNSEGLGIRHVMDFIGIKTK